MVSFFSADEKALKKFLEGDSAVNWSSPYIIAGELWAVQRNILGACVLLFICYFYYILKHREVDFQEGVGPYKYFF